MQINWYIVRIFGALIISLHILIMLALLFALYAKSDPQTAAQIIQEIQWYKLLNPTFEMILALVFLVYVILIGSLSVLINISRRLDESVSILTDIREVLRNSKRNDSNISLRN